VSHLIYCDWYSNILIYLLLVSPNWQSIKINYNYCGNWELRASHSRFPSHDPGNILYLTITYFQWYLVMARVKFETRMMTERFNKCSVTWTPLFIHSQHVSPLILLLWSCHPAWGAFLLLLSYQQPPTSSAAIILITQNLVCC